MCKERICCKTLTNVHILYIAGLPDISPPQDWPLDDNNLNYSIQVQHPSLDDSNLRLRRPVSVRTTS